MSEILVTFYGNNRMTWIMLLHLHNDNYVCITVCTMWQDLVGAMRGVTVSMSAFLACHQCYCMGSSLAWGLNLRAVVCGIF